MVAKHKRSRLKQAITLFTLIVLIILIYSLRHDMVRAFHDFAHINALVLLLVIPIEALNYDAYARLLRSLLHTLGEKVSYWSMYRLTFELNFVNHILPSGGVSGISYFSVRAKSLGVPPAKSTLSQVTKLFMLYASFQPIAVAGLIFLAAKGHVNNFVILLATSLTTAAIIGTGIAIYIIESEKRITSTMTFITKAINRVIHIFRPNHPEVLKLDKTETLFYEMHNNYLIYKANPRALIRPFFYTMLANATEIAAIYSVYVAFGQWVNVGAVILAYEVANFAGLISIFPAGIGVYEGLMTGILAAAGVPPEQSIPVTIMWRIYGMAIQITPGYFFYQKAVKNGLTTKL